jgi:hypothetical protein
MGSITSPRYSSHVDQQKITVGSGCIRQVGSDLGRVG